MFVDLWANDINISEKYCSVEIFECDICIHEQNFSSFLQKTNLDFGSFRFQLNFFAAAYDRPPSLTDIFLILFPRNSSDIHKKKKRKFDNDNGIDDKIMYVGP